MRVCVVSHKQCWQDEAGNWMSSGGFPRQMEYIASLFDALTLVIEGVAPRAGGMTLPKHAFVVPLRPPPGTDSRRKLSVLTSLPYYLKVIGHHVSAADVVHVPSPGDISFLGMIMGLLLRKRLLVRYCSSWETNSETTAMNRLTRAMMRTFAGGRNVMLATGSGTGRPAANIHWTFATAVSEEEIERIHHPDLRRSVNTPLRLIYLGRLSPEKGVDALIEAISSLRTSNRLQDRLPHLTVVGDGPEKSRLLALVDQHCCSDLVSFSGHLNRHDLTKELLQADVCVLPSLSESFCKARLDAMLCGVPVITTEAGFGREIVGGQGVRGWIFPAGDVAALAATVEHVATEQIDWPAMRARCGEYVRAHTLERWAQQIGQICSQQWRLPLVEGKLCLHNR